MRKFWIGYLTLISLVCFWGFKANAEDTYNDRGLTALHEAVLAKDVEAVKSEIANGANVNARGKVGYEGTPLMYAASNPDPTILNILLEAGADLNIRDKMGDPALNWASYYGNKDIIQTLLTKGARTDLRGHGNALEILMRRGHQELIIDLLNHTGMLKALSAAERHAIEAVDRDDAETLTKSLELGLDPDTRDETHRPILHRAARQGNVRAVNALIAAGADVNAADSLNFTALFEAARDGKSNAVATLIEAGANVNVVSTEHGLLMTPLHMAAIGGDSASVALIANAGADLEAVGTQGGTAMLWASYEGKIDAVITLLQLGANPDHKNMYGGSLRDIAKQMNDEKLNKALEAL